MFSRVDRAVSTENGEPCGGVLLRRRGRVRAIGRRQSVVGRLPVAVHVNRCPSRIVWEQQSASPTTRRCKARLTGARGAAKTRHGARTEPLNPIRPRLPLSFPVSCPALL